MKKFLPTLAANVAAHATSVPERIAVVDGRSTLTYSELDRTARGLATSLIGLGLRPGCVVSVQLPNRAEFVIAAVACSYAQFVFSPLSIRHRRAEIGHALATSGSRTLIVVDAYRDFSHAALAEELAQDMPDLRRVVVGAPEAGQVSFESLIEASPGPLASAAAEAPALILLTSGTEGPSKLVLHAETSLMAASGAMIERGGLVDGEVVLIGIPISTSAGNHGLARNGLLLGGTLVLLEQWQPQEAAAAIAAHGCTYTLAPTTVLFDLVRLPEASRGDLRSLRLLICGGAPIPRALVREAWDVLGCTVTPMYGASECLAATTCAADDPMDYISDTDGHALPGVEVAAFDGEGLELPAGEQGELGIAGPTLFLGYLDAPGEVRRPLNGRWWMSGDIGLVDTAGYVHVVDRKKDIIVRAGVNLSSKEIEEALLKHPAIAQCAVVGMPDDRLGQRICAFVVTAGDPPRPAELEAHIQSLGLARQKTPEHIEPVTELPLNASGKVQKHVLRERAARIGALTTT